MVQRLFCADPARQLCANGYWPCGKGQSRFKRSAFQQGQTPGRSKKRIADKGLASFAGDVPAPWHGSLRARQTRSGNGRPWPMALLDRASRYRDRRSEAYHSPGDQRCLLFHRLPKLFSGGALRIYPLPAEKNPALLSKSRRSTTRWSSFHPGFHTKFCRWRARPASSRIRVSP